MLSRSFPSRRICGTIEYCRNAVLEKCPCIFCVKYKSICGRMYFLRECWIPHGGKNSLALPIQRRIKLSTRYKKRTVLKHSQSGYFLLYQKPQLNSTDPFLFLCVARMELNLPMVSESSQFIFVRQPRILKLLSTVLTLQNKPIISKLAR